MYSTMASRRGALLHGCRPMEILVRLPHTVLHHKTSQGRGVKNHHSVVNRAQQFYLFRQRPELNNEGLLQHVEEGGYTWAQNVDSWWDCLHKGATIAQKEALLGAPEIDTLKNVLPQMAVHHKRCQLQQTLWVHLWVDHLLGLAKQWHALGAFAALVAEERHKTLKTQIRFRSFKGQGKERKRGGTGTER